ncbi:MAG TPA: hypothetical protein VN130_02395 [Xanthobacteraceae bacterium]|nr:hypothetical protein [Xanthobacteraceae bacterium]
MLARFVLGALTIGALVAPAVAGEMNASEARKFVIGKVFAFTCFDGTRGAGRIFDDGSAAGSIQFSGSGPTRYMRLPSNTLQTRGESVCASLKGLPFSPCFNLDKKDERSFRGAVSGMGFAYCDFHHKGAGHIIMARAISGKGPRSLHPRHVRSADATSSEVVARVETPRVERSKIAPVQTEAVSELRRSTD